MGLTKMATEPKAAWRRALESEEYAQSMAALHPDEGYCCLGVLCEVAKAQGVIDGYDRDLGEPPTEVMEWAGLDTAALAPLINMNDVDGMAFADISDWIEEYL